MLYPANEQVAGFERLFSPGVSVEDQLAILNNLNATLLAPEALLACARYLLRNTDRVEVGKHVIDINRVLNPQLQTFNISLAASFIAVGAGIQIAKHCIGALDGMNNIVDVLQQLQVPIPQNAGMAAQQLQRFGITFCVPQVFIPMLSTLLDTTNKAVRAASIQFIHQILPLCHPATLHRMVLSVAQAEFAEAYVASMGLMGLKEGYVISCEDAQNCQAIEQIYYHYFDQSLTQEASWSNQIMGMKPYDISALQVDGADCKASVLLAILENRELGAKRQVALLHAAVAILLAYPERIGFYEAFGLAQESLESGAARNVLSDLQE